MDYSKPYVEYYAKLNVDLVMKLRPTFLKKSERPDFVSSHREVGLEVTRAVIEQWAQQEADMNRHFGPDMPGEAVEQDILFDCINAKVPRNRKKRFRNRFWCSRRKYAIFTSPVYRSESRTKLASLVNISHAGRVGSIFTAIHWGSNERI